MWRGREKGEKERSRRGEEKKREEKRRKEKMRRGEERRRSNSSTYLSPLPFPPSLRSGLVLHLDQNGEDVASESERPMLRSPPRSVAL